MYFKFQLTCTELFSLYTFYSSCRIPIICFKFLCAECLACTIFLGPVLKNNTSLIFIACINLEEINTKTLKIKSKLNV